MENVEMLMLMIFFVLVLLLNAVWKLRDVLEDIRKEMQISNRRPSQFERPIDRVGA